MASGDLQNTKRKPSGKKAKKLNQKEQSKRFIETARKLDADESGTRFERVVKSLMNTETTPIE